MCEVPKNNLIVVVLMCKVPENNLVVVVRSVQVRRPSDVEEVPDFNVYKWSFQSKYPHPEFFVPGCYIVATTTAAAVATTAGSSSTTTATAVATSVTHHRSSSSHHRSSSSHHIMTIDKSWTTISSRNSNAFLDGLFAFIAHCEPLLHPITRKIRCPCSRCCNCDNLVTLKTLEVHISRHGFDQHYTTWKYHGEPILPLPPPVPHSPEHIDMDAFFEDISANNVPTPPTQTTGPQPAQTTGPNNEFEELLSRSTQKLYPGCDMTTLEFTSEISHIKVLHKISDAGFNKILALLQKACSPSKGYNFPSSYYEIKKTYKKIGLGYESIHACINDCFLFWGSEDNLKMPNCPVCKASRYKDPKKTKGKLVANKVVRYFPLTQYKTHSKVDDLACYWTV
ncbi:hypothetical protein Tco_1025066 [Tanacetum coccineum]